LQHAARAGIYLEVAATYRSRGPLLLAGGLAVALGALRLFGGAKGPQHAAGDTPGRAENLTARTAGSTTAAPAPQAPAPRATAATPESSGDGDGEPGGDEAPAGAVQLVNPVDLAALRDKLPDNLYWQLGAPTEDPEVLGRRREEEERMNDLLGKVQSGAATEEEINQYYDRRKKISEDYIEFASAVLEDYGRELSEEDQGLYALSVRMHKAKLEEIPRKVADALARRELQERRREEWRTNSAR
jgi:hypothetical protein